MELSGDRYLPLPQAQVWAALNDEAILRASIPGCESLERAESDQFQVVMAATVGPIKARFKGKLKLNDLVPPQSYALSFEGSGGSAGFGKGSASVTLVTEDQGTRLRYLAQAQVGGRLAQVGNRLIDAVAGKMAQEFFDRFTETVLQNTGAAAASAPVVPHDKGAKAYWPWLAAALAIAAGAYLVHALG